MSISQKLLEEYNEEFHRPDGSIALLTKSQAQFIRAVMRCNQINETYRTYENEDPNNNDNSS